MIDKCPYCFVDDGEGHKPTCRVVADKAPEREERKPFWAKCPSCSHCWPAAYLHMEISQVVKLMKKAACPNCGETKKIGIAKQDDGALQEPTA